MTARFKVGLSDSLGFGGGVAHGVRRSYVESRLAPKCWIAGPRPARIVNNTARLGRFKITSYTRRENGLLRIRFKLTPWSEAGE